MMELCKTMAFDEAWEILLKKGIEPLRKFVKTETICVSSFNLTKEKEDICTMIPDKQKLFTNSQFMELYSTVYNMSTQQYDNTWAEQLYERHEQVLKDYLEKNTFPTLQEAKETTGFLHLVACEWKKFYFFNKWMQKIFCYLDRFYIKASKNLPLEQKGFLLFQKIVFSLLRDWIHTHLFQAIHNDRQSLCDNQNIIQCLVNLYIALDPETLHFYTNEFEQYLLPSTREYYETLSKEWIETLTFSQYIQNAEQSLQQETQRSLACFHISTQPKLLAVIRGVLITYRLDQLLKMETGITYLLENKCEKDLHKAVQLFSSVENGQEVLFSLCRDFFSEKCCEMLQKCSQRFCMATLQATGPHKTLNEDPSNKLLVTQSIEELIDFYEKGLAFTETCFSTNKIFRTSIQQALEKNNHTYFGIHIITSLLVCYTDNLLQTTSCNLSETLLHLKLNQVINFFSCIYDKDFFLDLYQARLAQRILFGTLCSFPLEVFVAKKLQAVCGSQLTFKIKGILKDTVASNHLIKEFYEDTFMKEQNDLNTLPDLIKCHLFCICVLTTSHWPTYPLYNFKLPSALATSMELFHTFYTKKKTTHRRLTWVHHIATVYINAFFNDHYFEIQCNTLQCSILLLFNETLTLTFNEILNTLQVDKIIAWNHITPLVNCHLLKKHDLLEEYSLTMNIPLSTQLIKVPLPTTEEEHLHEKTDEDRSIAIEAAMIRIMKHLKTLTHTQLVKETMNQLIYFKPNITIINEKITSLIERDFFKVTDSATLEYTYVP